MGLIDPRIAEIQAAVMRRPDLPRTHYIRNFGVGQKLFDEWCEAGLLNIPKRKTGRRPDKWLFTKVIKWKEN
jgi:hypothetical protein